MQSSNANRICPRLYSDYIWQPGDTLAAVARQKGVTEQSIRNANTDVNFASVTAGTNICIPPAAMSCDLGNPYTVKPGDTIQSIAAAYGVTVQQLLAINPGQGTAITAGQVLCVPAQSSGGTPPQTQPPTITPPAATPPTTTPPTTPPPQTTPPTITPPVSASCPIGYEARAVRAGQTYADLLIDNNVSYRAMQASNPYLNPAQLVAGARYCAPPSGTRQLCSRSRTYRVQAGENLAMVAARFRTTAGHLLMLNPCLLPTDFTEGAMVCVPLL